MSITFNTNLAALTAQRNLMSSSNATAASLSKLSSGSRVPSAKDDAAGLAVGSKLKAEVAALSQASNNTAQANSLLQIADGALSTIGDMLTRMKTLAVQSSSGQLSDTERSLLNQEFTNLRSEIDRIANVTNFNGTSLLSGGGTGTPVVDTAVTGGLSTAGITAKFDTALVGNGDAFNITYAFNDAGGAYNANTASTYTSDTYKMTVTNTTTGASQTVDITDALRAKTGSYDPTVNLSVGTTMDVSFASLGVTLTLDSTFNKDTAALSLDTTAAVTNGTNQTLGAGTVDWATSGLGQTAIDALQALGASVYNAATGALTLSVDSDGSNVTTFNAVTGLRFQLNGGTLAADNTASGDIENGATNIVSVYLTNGGGAGVQTKLFDMTVAATTSAGASGATDGTYVLNLPTTMFGVSYASGGDTKNFSFKVGTGTTTNDSISFSLGAATASVLGIGSSTVDTASNADAAITALNSAISTVASRRADIGANQSRLDFAASSLSVSIENTTAAESTLMDVDVSSEITKFTSQNVLVQAGVSLLSQANQQPAMLLKLLQ